MNKISISELEHLVSQGFVIKQMHPILPLIIWNYSQKVQYEKLWKINPLISQCRGLVTDRNGKIVARCIKKFFNIEELEPKDIPVEPFTITEKMDGSYISVFFYDGQWCVASRGSFISDQSIKARELLFSKYNVLNLFTDYTYIFEILYPENRIVVNYGDAEKLVMITAFHTETGKEVSIKEMVNEGFEIVKSLDEVDDYREIKSMISDNQEGYVVRFKNGFRMKIKGNEYIRLHRILTNISNRDIWKYLKEGNPLDELLEKVPDEFYSWVRDTESALKLMYDITFNVCHMKFYSTIEEGMTRKEAALKIKELPRNFHAPLFLLLDGKNISNWVWDSLYPKFEKPFKKVNNDEI